MDGARRRQAGTLDVVLDLYAAAARIALTCAHCAVVTMVKAVARRPSAVRRQSGWHCQLSISTGKWTNLVSYLAQSVRANVAVLIRRGRLPPANPRSARRHARSPDCLRIVQPATLSPRPAVADDLGYRAESVQRWTCSPDYHVE